MSAISIRCPGCKHRLAAPPEAAGRSLPCPHCRAAVSVPADSNATLVDENAPDFSYLRNQPEPDDDILVAEDTEDGESALGQSTARRPAPPTVTSKTTAVVPPPVIYTPPPVGDRPPDPPDNPFAQLSGPPSSKRRASPLPPPAEPVNPPQKAKDKPRDRRPEPAPQPPARTPKWVWPVLIALTLYAFVATGVGAWGWLRPVAPPPTPTKPAR